MTPLLVASRNRGKLRELAGLLGPRGIEVIGLDGLEGVPDIEEDGETFLENARKKARTLAACTSLPVLADDSGLSVEALGGAPGVRSARYSGPGATDARNTEKLLEDLLGIPPDRRRASFVCSMVLALPGGDEAVAEGRLEGLILDVPRGDGGFGYDPVFLVPERGLTLAEMDLDTKNRLSHRSRALENLLPELLAAVGAGG